MKRINTLLVSVAISSTMVTIPTPANAWGKFGHLTICDLAYRNMTDASRNELKKIFRIGQQGEAGNKQVYTSFNQACLEEDNSRGRPKDHYLNVVRSTQSITSPTCPVGISTCILAAIDKDLAFLRDRTQTPGKRLSTLKSLGHWLGDIHQPLHVSYEKDRGGNYIRATGLCGNAKKNTLHSVWDNCLLENWTFAKIKQSPAYKPQWSRFTITYRAVDSFRGIEARDATLISSWLSGSPVNWANESYELTIDQLAKYCVMKNTFCQYDQDKEEYTGKGDPSDWKVVDVDQKYINRFGPEIELRIRKAGYRLAHLVNTALDPNYRGR
jgi:S1/P1 Nuclease